jgi:hypothetical protein
MDSQTLINIAFSAFGTVAGWLFKVIWDAIKDLQTDQREIERELTDVYVRKDDYRIDIAEIKSMLGRIFDRLDRQADNK